MVFSCQVCLCPHSLCSLLLSPFHMWNDHQLKSLNPDLRVSTAQSGLSSPADRSFSPESCRSLLLRSSCLRLENWELRNKDSTSQVLSDRLHTFSLKNYEQEHNSTGFKVYSMYNKKTTDLAIFQDQLESSLPYVKINRNVAAFCDFKTNTKTAKPQEKKGSVQ